MRKKTLEKISEKRIESSQDEEEILLKISSLGDEYFYNVVDSLARENNEIALDLANYYVESEKEEIPL